MSYLRPLNTIVLAKVFAEDVLQLTGSYVSEAAERIMSAEKSLVDIEKYPTSKYVEYRHSDYSSESSREMLREKIFKELINKKRLKNDDSIKLGKGGCLPNSELQCNKQAFFIIGLPASGKSTISNSISEEYGAIILDSDYAKRKFPEFKRDHGASLLHEESTNVVFGDPEKLESLSIKGFCVSEGINVVIPKIGNSENSIIKLAKYFKEKEYKVHLTLVELDRRKATIRAYNRFLKSNRYVPLSLVFDFYSNEPTLTYYRLKERENIFDSYGHISTDVPADKKSKYVSSTDGNPANIFIES